MRRVIPSFVLRATFAVIFLGVFFSGTAMALSLDEAKQQGLVGELHSGYLGAVQSAPSAEVKALVDDINAKRRAHYQAIAKKNGTNIAAVEKVAAQKAIKLTGSGQFVNAGAGWQKK